MNLKCLIFFALVLSESVSCQTDKMIDNDGELCNRECVQGRNRICYFQFFLEHYHAMGPACKACARGNFTDCLLDQCIVGDMTEKGCQSINRMIPGPAIQVCKDDTVVVDVVNHALGTAASIHWHGIHMKKSPFMDGVPFLTQCPISFGNTFRYKFTASESGTHFYHSHAGHHKVNGQYGALIVREPRKQDPNGNCYDVDSSDHYMLVSDWQHSYGEQVFPGLPSGGLSADSVLINGIGTYLDPITAQPKTNGPVAVFYVEHGKRYRFRLISSVSHPCLFQVQVENHRMTVIASDSFNVKPKVVDTLIINSGERYDFIVSADQDFGDYWIRVRGIELCSDPPMESFALLRYVRNPTHINKPVDYNTLREKPAYGVLYPDGVVLNHPNAPCFGSSYQCVNELQSTEAESDKLLKLNPDKVFYMGLFNHVVSNDEIFQKGTYRTFMNVGSNITVVGAIDRIALKLPSYPPLTQPWDIKESHFCDRYNMPARCAKGNTTICACAHRVKVNLGDIVDVLVVDDREVPGIIHHPFHLHGVRFVVKNMGPFKNENMADGNSLRKPFKDTITVPSNGFVSVRFRADNPGYWLMHCHYEWHVNIGMGLILQVGEPYQMVPPPKGFPQCGNYKPDF